MAMNMSTGIDIRQLEKSQRLAPFAHGIIEAYNNREHKITAFIKMAAAVFIITPISIFTFRRINKEQKKILYSVKSQALSNEKDFDQLLKLYKALDKLVHALGSIATLSAKEYDSAYKSAPLLLKPMLKPVFNHMKLNLELHKALGEKLCLSPKNVTTQQLEAVALSKEEMEDFFDDDDDDYIEYAKELSMRQSGH
jgi:hypothetical protein